ncbi:MAG: YDG domain-containing protein [Paludibacteraceae bacterium]
MNPTLPLFHIRISLSQVRDYFFLILFFFAFTGAKAQFAGGNGSSATPYRIETVDQLYAVRNYSGAIYFILTADIDMIGACQSGGSYYNSGAGWLPFPFQCILDGQGHTITGLMINRPTTEAVGLFSSNYGTIRNVILKNVSVTGRAGVGALVGTNGSRPDNRYGSIYTSCVTGASYVTGLNGGTAIGGLVGYNDIGSWVRTSYSGAAVTGSNNYVGGLVGFSKSGIEYSYAYGKVATTGTGADIGGLLGANNSGDYDGDDYAATVTSCYYNSAASGRSDNNGRGVPLTIAQMMQSSNFSGWDFTATWNITAGSSYPYLRTATANPLPSPYLTITGSFTASNKTYNGTTATTITTNSLTLSGDIGYGDVVSLTGVTAAFANANAGTGKTVSLTAASLAGTNAGRYLISLTGAPTATATINAAPLTITGSFTANNKVYDGTTAATIATNSLTLSGVVSGDDVSLTNVTAAFADANSGTGKTVSLTSSTTLGGTKAGNYSLSLTGAPTATANITIAGSGTSADPWQIRTAADLDAVRNNLSAHYKVMNDIDLASYLASGGAGYNSGAGWNPIGTFTGTFDGGGHILSNLSINGTSISQYVGLFGINSGTIQNIVLKDAHVSGNYSVGSLVGWNNNTVSVCCVTGSSSVVGRNTVGGLVGWNANTISNCYTTCSVSGTDASVGGLAGCNSSTAVIQYCYACGAVSGTNNYPGGLIGYNGGAVTNSYYNSATSGQSNTGKGIPLTTTDMVKSATYSGWDFSFVWNIIEGSSYPYLRALTVSPFTPPVLTIGGTFTVSDKVYDGTTAATITSQSLTLAGIASGDVVTLNAGASFVDANVGTGKTVTLATSTFGGAQGGKYNLSLTGAPVTTASISKQTVVSTPAAPMLSGKTATSVTLNTVAGCEYRVNGGFWQDSPVFTGLTPSTAYSFTQRVKATANTNASAESAALTVSTLMDGSGTQIDPWQIRTAADLDAVRNNLSHYYKLMNDIDLAAYVASGGAGYNGGYGWDPINGFTGHFDGQNHTLSNLSISRSSNNIGLFAVCSGAVIQNLTLSNASVIGGTNTGCLSGYVDLSSSITNCHITGSTVTNGSSDNNYIGGLLGHSKASAVSGCDFSGSVTGPGPVGGLIGINDNYGATTGTVSKCYSTGTVNGTYNSGGLVGFSSGTISDCYSAAAVTGNNKAGGLVGTSDGTVTNCYSYGPVSSTYNTGGLMGYNYGSVTSSYYNSATSGQSDTGKGIPETTAWMVQQSNYSGWDFSTVWVIQEGSSYPYLLSNIPNPLPAVFTLTLSGSFTANDKVYDGTTAATVNTSGLTLSGIASGDVVTIAGATAVFSDANVGTNKTVTLTSVTLAGSAASKYLVSLTGAPATTASIIPVTPAVPTLSSRTTTSVTLNTVAGCEYRVNGGVWQDSPVFMELTPSTAYSFTQRVKATSNSNASAESAVLTVTTPIGGSGTSADPWQITTAADLDAVRNNPSAYYKVMNDIDLTSYVASGGVGYNSGAGWNPIGGNDNPFTGVFDGNGKTISSLNINRSGQDRCGLFGSIGLNAVIKNVGLVNATVSGKNDVGGLVGERAWSYQRELLCTSSVTGTGGSGSSSVGGLVGSSDSSDDGVAGSISNCYATGSVTAGNSNSVGGLVGYSYRSVITNCYAACTVTGYSYVGGLIRIRSYRNR